MPQPHQAPTPTTAPFKTISTVLCDCNAVSPTIIEKNQQNNTVNLSEYTVILSIRPTLASATI
ncbi:hypothetical protein, partial [Kaarinaea lacus]